MKNQNEERSESQLLNRFSSYFKDSIAELKADNRETNQIYGEYTYDNAARMLPVYAYLPKPWIATEDIHQAMRVRAGL